MSFSSSTYGSYIHEIKICQVNDLRFEIEYKEVRNGFIHFIEEWEIVNEVCSYSSMGTPSLFSLQQMMCTECHKNDVIKNHLVQNMKYIKNRKF